MGSDPGLLLEVSQAGIQRQHTVFKGLNESFYTNNQCDTLNIINTSQFCKFSDDFNQSVRVFRHC